MGSLNFNKILSISLSVSSSVNGVWMQVRVVVEVSTITKVHAVGVLELDIMQSVMVHVSENSFMIASPFESFPTLVISVGVIPSLEIAMAVLPAFPPPHVSDDSARILSSGEGYFLTLTTLSMHAAPMIRSSDMRQNPRFNEKQHYSCYNGSFIYHSFGSSFITVFKLARLAQLVRA
jgi:hypothetical protein